MSNIKVYKKVKCIECKNKYEQKRKWQKFCSAKCRWMNFDKTHPRIKIEGNRSVK